MSCSPVQDLEVCKISTASLRADKAIWFVFLLLIEAIKDDFGETC